VVAALYPLAFAAAQIGGDTVDVTNLTPPGAEPHDVELSVRDVEAVRSADVVLYLGEGLQPAVAAAAEGASGTAIDLLEGIDLRADGDPHAWLDPTLYAAMALRIGEPLDRPGAAEDFADRLHELDADYERGLESCERREIVTSHAAFGYLADRYGLEQIAVTGLAPATEPAAADLERLAGEIEATGATTVFTEPLVSPRLAETVARESGVETATLDPLEGVTEEAAERGDDYFTIMRENLEALREALGCR
jgi:zinc transport system substrate-binding protein